MVSCCFGIDDGVAGVVVSCKIPILATRVRFPGDAKIFSLLFLLTSPSPLAVGIV